MAPIGGFVWSLRIREATRDFGVRHTWTFQCSSFSVWYGFSVRRPVMEPKTEPH